jgi:diadenosine tetraphosphate (Ap4A) HIT family hydrolase
MINATLAKFGYPDTLLREYPHWCVLLRPAQATLGALVLVCKDEARALPQISSAAFAELKDVTGDVERALATFRRFGKINYLMLMMVDPDVHFHVLPRYAEPQTFEGLSFPDPGWPGVPNLAAAITLEPSVRHKLLTAVKAVWPA